MNKDGKVDRYKARVSTRRSTQIKAIDYNDKFTPATR